MEIFVKGVKIKLTKEQIDLIEQNDAKIEKCRNSFVKMLKHFHFEQWKDDKDYFSNPTTGWVAEILDRGNYKEVWMIGDGLKTSSFPGGWIYSSPEQIEMEILRALEKLN